ncbi:MAG: helix-turn-helix domain-containing protein [Pseudomonadota bacterium]
MPSFSAKPRSNVVFVTFPNAKLLDVTGPIQVFTDAKRFGGEDYEISIVSAEGGDQLTDTCVPLRTESIDLWHDRPIHTLLIAGGLGASPAAQDPAIVSGVSALARRSSRIGSVCTGAYILAAAGLLDGCRAVTHWVACGDLAKKHPEVAVEPDRIYVKDTIWTSAGVTAGIDMALAMIAEDSGRKVALTLARALVAYMARPGGQAQFSAVLQSQTDDADGKFDDLHTWIANHLDEDLRVERLAQQAGMSVRNFARVYQTTTGRTPAKAVELFRITAARNQLEETDDPITTIARKTGFTDDERLRRAMQRVLGLSPTQCRERFGRIGV